MDEIKDPEYPVIIDKDVIGMNELKEFFNKDKEVIKSHLNSIDGTGSKIGFSLSTEEMCLMVSKDNFEEYYKIMRDEIIHVSGLIMKSHEDLIIESVDIPIIQKDGKITCLMKVNFKRK